MTTENIEEWRDEFGMLWTSTDGGRVWTAADGEIWNAETGEVIRPGALDRNLAEPVAPEVSQPEAAVAASTTINIPAPAAPFEAPASVTSPIAPVAQTVAPVVPPVAPVIPVASAQITPEIVTPTPVIPPVAATPTATTPVEPVVTVPTETPAATFEPVTSSSPDPLSPPAATPVAAPMEWFDENGKRWESHDGGNLWNSADGEIWDAVAGELKETPVVETPAAAAAPASAAFETAPAAPEVPQTLGNQAAALINQTRDAGQAVKANLTQPGAGISSEIAGDKIKISAPRVTPTQPAGLWPAADEAVLSTPELPTTELAAEGQGFNIPAPPAGPFETLDPAPVVPAVPDLAVATDQNVETNIGLPNLAAPVAGVAAAGAAAVAAIKTPGFANPVENAPVLVSPAAPTAEITTPELNAQPFEFETLPVKSAETPVVIKTKETAIDTHRADYPEHVIYKPANRYRGLIGALFGLTSVAAVITTFISIKNEQSNIKLIALALVILALALWWVLVTWTPTVIEIAKNMLTISKGRDMEQFDLNSPYLNIDVDHDVNSPSWQATITRPDNSVLKIPAGGVDAAEFSAIVNSYRSKN